MIEKGLELHGPKAVKQSLFCFSCLISESNHIINRCNRVAQKMAGRTWRQELRERLEFGFNDNKLGIEVCNLHLLDFKHVPTPMSCVRFPADRLAGRGHKVNRDFQVH